MNESVDRCKAEEVLLGDKTLDVICCCRVGVFYRHCRIAILNVICCRDTDSRALSESNHVEHCFHSGE